MLPEVQPSSGAFGLRGGTLKVIELLLLPGTTTTLPVLSHYHHYYDRLQLLWPSLSSHVERELRVLPTRHRARLPEGQRSILGSLEAGIRTRCRGA